MIFKHWQGTARYVYNLTIEWIDAHPESRMGWMDLYKNVIAPLLPEWAKAVPFQVKKIAVKDAFTSFIENKKKAKRTGKPFQMRFKSRKNPTQSCFIPDKSISERGLYYTISGNLNFRESLPEKVRDSRLVCESDRWFIVIPVEVPRTSESQAERVVALDPGVRTFLTFYSPDLAGFIGSHDFGRLTRLCKHLDDLLSRMAHVNSHTRRRMKRAANRLRWKIKDLRNELHWKAIDFLLDEFDVVLLPSFDVSQMVTRAKRKLHKKTVRAMLTWAHYEFEMKLKAKAEERGKTVVIVNEAYTSKTCSWSGEIVKVGSREIIRGSDGTSMHRDMNGARGIYLRALADTPLLA